MLNQRQKILLKIQELDLINDRIEESWHLAIDPAIGLELVADSNDWMISKYFDKLDACKVEHLTSLEREVDLSLNEAKQSLEELKND